MPYINGDLIGGITNKELHIFYLLDISGSMTGQPIAQLNDGLRSTMALLKNKLGEDSNVHLRISIMTFASEAKWVTGTPESQFSEYIEDYEPIEPLNAYGMTNLGEALSLLNHWLSRERSLKSATGNKRPIIIFMTDGQPNDDWMKHLSEIQQNRWYDQAIKIAIALGENADRSVMARVVGTENAVLSVLDTAQLQDMLRIVSITSSLANARSTVENNNNDIIAQVNNAASAVIPQPAPAPAPAPNITGLTPAFEIGADHNDTQPKRTSSTKLGRMGERFRDLNVPAPKTIPSSANPGVLQNIELDDHKPKGKKEAKKIDPFSTQVDLD